VCCAVVRELENASLQKAFLDAASAGRGGLVREVLTSQHPRLAQLLDDTITKLLQYTEVCPALPPAAPHMFLR
jgi:hypothetical protein